jgi:hypothetical protein
MQQLYSSLKLRPLTWEELDAPFGVMAPSPPPTTWCADYLGGGEPFWGWGLGANTDS